MTELRIYDIDQPIESQLYGDLENEGTVLIRKVDWHSLFSQFPVAESGYVRGNGIAHRWDKEQRVTFIAIVKPGKQWRCYWVEPTDVPIYTVIDEKLMHPCGRELAELMFPIFVEQMFVYARH